MDGVLFFLLSVIRVTLGWYTGSSPFKIMLATMIVHAAAIGITISFLLATGLSPAQAQDAKSVLDIENRIPDMEEVLRMHYRAVVADGHNDILLRAMKGTDITLRSNKGHSDLPRFREGGVDVQLFPVWVPPKKFNKKGNAWRFALAEADSLEAVLARSKPYIRSVRGGADIDAAVYNGQIGAVLALEGGRCIESSPERIIVLYRRGLRSFGLTWNNSTGWATAAKDESKGRLKKKGLTPLGRSFVRLLDSLGCLIDLSHSGEATFWDVLETTTNPVFASHSSCKQLRSHFRNLTDKQLRALAANGGVAMVNFLPYFLRDGVNAERKNVMRKYSKSVMALKKKHEGLTQEFAAGYDRIIADASKRKCVTILDVVDHIDHIVSVAGACHVGIGSDFDGIGIVPVGLEDVTMLPMLTRELLRRGYSEKQIMNILGGNFVRIFREVCG